MTAPVLADALGPRARRRTTIATGVALVLLAALAYLAIRRFQQQGQLEADKWELLSRWSVLRFLLLGLVNTLRAAAVAMVLAAGIGGLMALGRLSRSAPIRWATGAYVEFFRAVPLLLLILFAALGLPKYGFDFSIFWYLVMALVAYNSAVLAEIFRSGILSLDRGQFEASQAIGLRYWPMMLTVIVPQALRRMVPAVVSQLITLLKDTSLAFFVGYEELLRRGQITGEFGRNLLQSLFLVAIIYLLVNLLLSRLARRLEVRQRRRYSAGSITVSGLEDLAAVDAAATAESAKPQR